MNRREMLSTMGLATAGLMAGSTLLPPGKAQAGSHHHQGPHLIPGFDAASGEYVQPPLPYAYDALEPYIDAETMRLHYTMHAAGYVRGLNAALTALAKARAENDFALAQYWANKVSFNGGGHTLHTIFWTNMAPAGQGGGGEPAGALRDMIERDFGSVERFKAQFSATATQVEGGGWGICGVDQMSGNLLIIQGENQQKLTTWAITPVLVLDVWEHAYYLKYQNRRAQYVANWWNIVNWDDMARRCGVANG